MNNRIVAKFGGTSMGSIESLQHVVEIIKSRKVNIVIVSATSGTTDQLMNITQLAGQGLLTEAELVINDIELRHVTMLDQTNPSTVSVDNLQGFIQELKALTSACCHANIVSQSLMDQILSVGELLSSTILVSLLEKNGHDAVEWFDARDVLITDGRHGKAKPNIAAIKLRCHATLANPASCYVGQGFIGATEEGINTTLGRGGSDYSAALFAEAIDAKQLQIWTDVPGLSSTDPRICDTAKPIAKISFKEASEMATFGAKILHPSSLLPAIRKNIPVFVGSTFKANEPGTLIEIKAASQPRIRAVTVRKKQVLVVINNPDMLSASGFLRRVFEIFERYQISIDAITTSEISIAVTIDSGEIADEQIKAELIAELEKTGEITIEEGLALIAVVGNNLPSTPNIGIDIFKALENINVRMITHGASSYNFCLVVAEQQANDAVRRLHQSLLV